MVRVALKRQLDDSDDFLGGGVCKVLILIIALRLIWVQHEQLIDCSAVGWSEAALLASFAAPEMSEEKC